VRVLDSIAVLVSPGLLATGPRTRPKAWKRQEKAGSPARRKDCARRSAGNELGAPRNQNIARHRLRANRHGDPATANSRRQGARQMKTVWRGGSGSQDRMQALGAKTGRADWRAPEAQGLFDPRDEKDSCGVGFIA